MNFEQELDELLKKEKIRKNMPDTVDLRAYRLLVHSLQWASIEYSSSLYLAGKKLGKKILANKIKEDKDIEKIIIELNEIFSCLCLGKLEVREVEKNTAIVRLLESASAFNMKPVNSQLCFFEGGIIAGVLESKLKKDIEVKETLCCGLGDEVDEFNIRIGQ